MKILKFIFIFILVIIFIINDFNADVKIDSNVVKDLAIQNVKNFSVYYGNINDSVINILNDYDLVILQHWAVTSNNLSEIKGIKIAYIDLGEYDNSTYPNCTVNLTGIVIGYDNEWNQPIVNVSSPKWINYTICRVKYDIGIGFNGVMFDDLDVVEQYPWEAQGFVKIISIIRNDFPNIIIGVNRGFEIFNNISKYINFVLYEDFGTYYNFSANGYYFLNNSEIENVENNVKNIESNNVEVFGLGYSPSNCSFFTYFDYSLGRELNIPVYVSNWNLTSLYLKCVRMENFYEDFENYLNIVKNQSDYIISSQLPDGAIKTSPSSNYINPYISNLAAIGLIKAYEITGDLEYIQSAEKWLIWYSEHMNVNNDNEGIRGTIYDYKISNGTEIPTYNYDSSDSYAASFIISIYDLYNATKNITFIEGIYKNIILALNAIFSTMNDNLTFAKPDYRVKMLMDNCEVYSAFYDASMIFKDLGNYSYSDFLKNYSNSIKMNILDNFLINDTYFRWSINGTLNFSEYYPDIMANYWPVIMGVIEWNSTISKNVFNFLMNLSYYEDSVNISNIDMSASYYSVLMGNSDLSEIITNTALSINNYTYYWNVEESSFIIQSFFFYRPIDSVVSSEEIKLLNNTMILNISIEKTNLSKILIYMPENFTLYANMNYSIFKINTDQYIKIEDIVSNNITVYYFFNISNRYYLRFLEHGIENSTWGVKIENMTEYSKNGSIVFYLPEGYYEYSIIKKDGYEISNSSGYIFLDRNLTINVYFIKIINYYNVTFISYGLGKNESWCIDINNSTIIKTDNQSIRIELMNGSYFYSICFPEGYSINNGTGKFLINGHNLTIKIEFKKLNNNNINYYIILIIISIIIISLFSFILSKRVKRGP